MAIDDAFNNSSDGMRKNPNLPATATSGLQDSSSNAYIGERDAEDLNDDAVDTLNNLLEICRDGEYGFTECAEHVKSAAVKSVFIQRASDCRSAAAELQELVAEMGGDPEDGGSMGGAMHRGWVSVKGTLTGYSDLSMLKECERGEDAALAQYRKALKENLPAKIHAVVDRQAQGTQKNHDQIRDMRDAHQTADSNTEG